MDNRVSKEDLWDDLKFQCKVFLYQRIIVKRGENSIPFYFIELKFMAFFLKKLYFIIYIYVKPSVIFSTRYKRCLLFCADKTEVLSVVNFIVAIVVN